MFPARVGQVACLLNSFVGSSEGKDQYGEDCSVDNFAENYAYEPGRVVLRAAPMQWQQDRDENRRQDSIED